MSWLKTTPLKLTPLQQFSNECRDEFGKLMKRKTDEALDKGVLATEEICTALACAAIHVQALAIIGGKFDPKDFDGLVAQDVADTRGKLARLKDAHARPLC